MLSPFEVVLPLLRAALPGATVGTWEPDVDHRTLPYVHLRRAGGVRSETRPGKLSFPEVEMTIHHSEGPSEAEELYETALDALLDAVRAQTVVPGVGYLPWLTETEGLSQVPSKIPDAFAAQGAVRVGLRSA